MGRFSRALIAATTLLMMTGASSFAGPALLFDASNGKVIYAEDPDNLWHPASLTKIMTAYLTFEAIKAGKLKLDTKIACSLVANLQPPSKAGLAVGTEITVHKALQALIVKSANDVAMMLAEAVAGSETAFVAQMNATARRLGMTRTNFVNPNGLPAAAQVTTARDLAKLARAVVAEYPEYAHYWAMPEMRLGKKKLASHNGLLRNYDGADGLKTGFICDSGFNVVASATRDGNRLMAIVLGETTGGERTIRAASLLDHGFQQYGWKMLFNQTTIDNMPLDPNAKGIVSMRDSVVSWNCGGPQPGKTTTAKAKGKKDKKAVAKEKSKDKTKAAAAAPPLPKLKSSAAAKADAQPDETAAQAEVKASDGSPKSQQ